MIGMFPIFVSFHGCYSRGQTNSANYFYFYFLAEMSTPIAGFRHGLPIDLKIK
jgi:hypothetical protein